MFLLLSLDHHWWLPAERTEGPNMATGGTFISSVGLGLFCSEHCWCSAPVLSFDYETGTLQVVRIIYGMCASYTETYQSYEVVTAGRTVYACYAVDGGSLAGRSVDSSSYQSSLTTKEAPYVTLTDIVGTKSLFSMTAFYCQNGYTFGVGNGSAGGGGNLRVTRCDNMCPYAIKTLSNWAVPGGWRSTCSPCYEDDNSTNWRQNGYTAPCGRKTTITSDAYGYVTRTRTTTYNKEAGCLSSTLYDTSDAAVSTRQQNMCIQ